MHAVGRRATAREDVRERAEVEGRPAPAGLLSVEVRRSSSIICPPRGGSPLFFVFFVFFVRGTSVLRGPDVGLECQIVARSKASMKACLGALLRGLGEEHLSVRASRGASVRRRFAGVGARSRAAEEPPRR